VSRVTAAVIHHADEITGSAQEHRKVHFTCCFFTFFLLKNQKPKTGDGWVAGLRAVRLCD
jgi:hypothetical protein